LSSSGHQGLVASEDHRTTTTTTTTTTATAAAAAALAVVTVLLLRRGSSNGASEEERVLRAKETNCHVTSIWKPLCCQQRARWRPFAIVPLEFELELPSVRRSGS
jgi:hypothetical protein